MDIRSVLLASLLLGLNGCQQQATSPQQAEPAAGSAAGASAVMKPVASEPVAPASAVEPAKVVAVEKVAEPVRTAAFAKVAAVAEKAAPAAKVAKPAEKSAVPASSASTPERSAPVSVMQPATIARIEAPVPAPVTPLPEADAMSLAKRNNCLACHAIDHRVVGPAWRDVAAKYRGDATAEAHLVSKIASGGSGVWGSMKMPAHPKISEADRTILARFVLNLK